ncbi:MAG: hypothetical protein H8E39_06165 [Alphaproteobacteria bacterium]|nr:hypothetical protein [Alphaproteobacteria bacterium]
MTLAEIFRRAVFWCALTALFLMPQAPVHAQDPGSGSVTHQMYLDMKLGKLNIHGDNAVVEALVLQRDLPITYDYIATLMRTPNAFGDGPACIVCHSSNDPAKSYRGLDLSSCEGILRGSTEEPPRSVIVPGKPGASTLTHMLRDNRMPLGVPFFHPIESDAINAVKDWIDSGGANDDTFKKKVLPLFSDPKAFGGEAPCIECHRSFRDPPSFNEVNLTSYEAIMKGAFSKTRGKQGKPGLPIVVPFDSTNSPLYLRLTRNRMPPGIDPGADNNHPNIQLLMRWIEQGAWCR